MAMFQIQNLPHGVRKRGLEVVFRQFSIVGVSEIEIIPDHFQGQGRPIGLITIDDSQAKQMYRIVGVSYLGRDLDIHEVRCS
jgi:hypothetical protein